MMFTHPGPCLPNIYERDPVIIRQAFRRKHSQSCSQGRGAGGCWLPPHPPPAPSLGCLRLPSTTWRDPLPALGGLEIRGDALVVLPNSTDMFFLINCNFSSLHWYLLCLITDIAGCWGSRVLPLSFYYCSARAGKTSELIFALAFPSV